MAFGVGFCRLEMTAFSVLQSYVDLSDGPVLGVQYLASNSAESTGRRRRKATYS